MNESAGYSRTPLARKLGIKEGHRIFLFHPPDYFWTLFHELPQDIVQMEEGSKESIDYMHFFVTDPKDLDFALVQNLPWLKKDGLLWISWPKKNISYSF